MLAIGEMRKCLEAFRPSMGGPIASALDENLTPTGSNLTNLLLIELLEKQSD